MSIQSEPIGYILKRFPRLSETFILNEIRALERLGAHLAIFSLLPREATPQHPTVSEVRARVNYLPAGWRQALWGFAKAHLVVAFTTPLRYLTTIGLALSSAVRHGHPIGACKHFLRAPFVALACRKQGIRHLHAHFANAPTSVARLVSVLCDLPYSFTAHAKDLYLTPKSILLRRISSAKFVLTCTRYNLVYLRDFVPREQWHKLHLVYHGIELSAFSSQGHDPGGPAPGTPDEAPIILSVGRLVPKKGMQDLILACDMLSKRGARFRCLIVGDGPLRTELQRRIEALGLSGVVTMLGAMAHDRLIELYGRATLFALVPQITEDGDRDGIPNVLIEAMAAGVAVVSTSVSGIPELIEHGHTGLLVQPRDPEAVAAALDSLLCDAASRRRLASAARDQLRGRFECWESTKALHRLLVADTPA